jgi:hypothetical protein
LRAASSRASTAAGPGAPPASTAASCALTIVPPAVWAGTDAGIFKSAGGGAWTAAGLPGVEIGALAVDPESPSTLWAATLGSGVYRSSSGVGWHRAGAGLAHPDVFALAILPSDPPRLYAGTFGGGVYEMTPSPPIFADGFESGDVSAWR